jgi:hypothetical protein
MDGVLVNFVQGALDHLKSDADINDVTWNFPVDIFGYPDPYHPDFWNQFGQDFWSNLDWTPEGKSLLKQVEEMVGQSNIGLLTTPMDTPGCIEGKRQWIAKHLPQYKKQLTTNGAKYLLAAPKKILVDDHDPNCLKFEKLSDGTPTGGKAVLVPRPWNCGKHRVVGKGGFNLPEIVREIRETIHQIV